MSSENELTLIIIMGIQPLVRFGQRPELSQATGMALVRCILDKFLGAVCRTYSYLLQNTKDDDVH